LSAPIKILLVDDHPVVRTGYRHLLETDTGLEVVAEADEFAAAYEAFKSLAPDIVVMDISLPGISGIEAVKRMRAQRPDARILIFSMHDDSIFVSRAMAAGAAGFLSKSSAPEKLIEAIRVVMRGEVYSDESIGKGRIPAAGLGAPVSELSNREVEVLRLWAQGLSLDDVGTRLGISAKTAANHLSLVRQKLSIQNDVQLMRVAESIWRASGP
jgi:two-component system, NarL family, invasion response regulator UvrY